MYGNGAGVYMMKSTTAYIARFEGEVGQHQVKNAVQHAEVEVTQLLR